MTQLKKILSRLVCSIIMLVVLPTNAETAYYRFPDAHNNQLVFTSQGDLWLANLDYSEETKPTLAIRLTSHPNIETHPQFSPNGDKIAFVADYNNMPAVYTISSTGGIAKQVSFEMIGTRLHGWVNDDTVLISTVSNKGMHNSDVLKTINVNNLKTSTVEISDATEGTMTSNGNTLVFIQSAFQTYNDNANFYKGGGKGELWKFNLDSSKEAILLSEQHQGSIRRPMVANGRIYFVSNQNGLDNIWSMGMNGEDIKQHTQHSDYAVRHPSLAGDTIVYQHGADIIQFNIKTQQSRRLNLSIQSDFVNSRTKFISNPLTYFNSANISPNGQRVAITARGKVATANTSSLRTAVIASEPTSRLRNALLSKDGKYVYAISNQTGEYEIWQYYADGSDDAKPLTSDGYTERTGLWLTPNGETLLHTDDQGNLYALNIETKKNKKLLKDISFGINDIAFSSQGNYIAFGFVPKTEERTRVYLYDLDTEKSVFVTSDKYVSYSPTFSDDTKWLYFLSDRQFSASPSSPWGDRNMGPAFNKRTQLFAVSLQKDAAFPFAAPTELDKPSETHEEDTEGEESANIKIEFDGIQTRLWQVDIPASDYSNLQASKDLLFVQDDKQLKSLSFKHDAKLKKVTSGVAGYELSLDRNSLLIAKGRGDSLKLYVTEAKASFPKNAKDNLVHLNDWTIKIEPKQEWQQMFKDAWLMHRDEFFDANMRGLDWPEVKQKYLPLVTRVNERSELNDVFKQMMGELNALHSQVRGGDINSEDDAPSYAVLGARLIDTNKGVQIEHIYQYDREILSQAPPLAMAGVNAQEKDFILAVNGLPVDSTAALSQALLNTAGQQVLLKLKRGRNEIRTVVVPTERRREFRLRYQDWVHTNLNKVNKEDEQIGYIHMYAMGRNDLASFARDFYAQYDKPGLIIDVRRNRGGNIDSIILEKLLRRPWSFWQRTTGEVATNMQQTFSGHIVVIADQYTYSDGETFTAGVKALDIGTVIGRQTAGAGVWLSGGNNVVDGGIARVAQYPVYALDGRWITEGRGISPDIEVVNLPHATAKGKDAQLEAAIQYLQKKLKEQPPVKLEARPFGPVQQPADDILPM